MNLLLVQCRRYCVCWWLLHVNFKWLKKRTIVRQYVIRFLHVSDSALKIFGADFPQSTTIAVEDSYVLPCYMHLLRFFWRGVHFGFPSDRCNRDTSSLCYFAQRSHAAVPKIQCWWGSCVLLCFVGVSGIPFSRIRRVLVLVWTVCWFLCGFWFSCGVVSLNLQRNFSHVNSLATVRTRALYVWCCLLFV